MMSKKLDFGSLGRKTRAEKKGTEDIGSDATLNAKGVPPSVGRTRRIHQKPSGLSYQPSVTFAHEGDGSRTIKVSTPVLPEKIKVRRSPTNEFNPKEFKDQLRFSLPKPVRNRKK